MTENKVVSLRPEGAIDDPLTEILRAGARSLIAQAVEAEFAAFLASHDDKALRDGRRRVVRHGHDPARLIQTGVGPVEAGDEIEQRGLAGAVRTDDADQLALGEVEIDRIDRGEATEAPRQPAQGQHGGLLRHHIVPNRPCGLNRTSSSSTMP